MLITHKSGYGYFTPESISSDGQFTFPYRQLAINVNKLGNKTCVRVLSLSVFAVTSL